MSVWRFKEEFYALAEKCTNVKPETAKKYARNLFKKYENECIVGYTYKEIQELQKSKRRSQKAIMCLRTNTITYNGGAVIISEVQTCKRYSDVILLTLKNSEEIRLKTDDFEHVPLIFGF